MTRRNFVQLSAAGATAAFAAPAASTLPWHRRALRWGQTNITEKDPERYDIPWWRDYWKRTAVQGVIINAGGIGPWWHMVGVWHQDRRMYNTPERIFQWHKQHEQYLIDRRPLASVGALVAAEHRVFRP